MPTQRRLYSRTLAPERVRDYIAAHDEVWLDLVALYKRSGIVDVSCFLHENRLTVMMETDPVIFEQKKQQLAEDPVEIRWQAFMREFNATDPAFAESDEVFRLADHLDAVPVKG